MQTPIRGARWRAFVPALLVAGLSMALVSCSSDSDDDDGDTGGTTVTMALSASGAETVPAIDTAASAEGSLELDPDTGALSGTVTTSGITATAAHLHDGYAGQTGDVVVALTVDGDTLSVPDGTVLDATQIAAIQAGAYYLNVHSDAYPNGEIRSQVAPEGIAVVITPLAGGNEVPAVDTAASGTAYVTLNTDSGLLDMTVLTSGLANPTASHLHGGFAGSNGDVIVGTEQDANDVSMFTIDGGTLTADQVQALLAGGTYVNVHSQEVPAGEIRGQVLVDGVSLLSASLDGTQEVPPVTSAATGSGVLTLNENAGTVTARVSTSGADDATAAHIHTGDAGTNGDVLLPLVADSENSGSWTLDEGVVDADQIATIKSAGTYFNVHTPANPGGEIRGQIMP